MSIAAEGLTALRRYAAGLAHLPWFAALGQELTAADRSDAAEYLAALGLAGRAIAPVGDWRAAEALTRAPDWDPAWWEAEEAARRALLAAATARHGEAPLLRALTAVTSAASDSVLGAASTAAAAMGVADPALARVAAGAATQAAYQHALALAAAAASGHAFHAKQRLFAAGRWPLGLVACRFHVF